MTASTHMPELSRLANRMLRAKDKGTPPFVLVIGSGAAPMSRKRLETDVLLVDGMGETELEAYSPAARLEAFWMAWRRISAKERFAVLDDIYREPKESLGEPDRSLLESRLRGYRGVARLCAEGYFDAVLTTNIDMLLEQAFFEAGVKPCDWQVLVNGRDGDATIKRCLEAPLPRLKVLKLHGDWIARQFAVSRDEVDGLGEAIEPVLRPLLEGPVLVVGDTTRDWDIRNCLTDQGEAFHYVSENRPGPGTDLAQIIQRRNASVISGERAEFGAFFSWLSSRLLGGDSPGEEAGLQTYVNLGINVADLSDETVESALESETPVIEFLSELREDAAADGQGSPLVDMPKRVTLSIRYGDDEALSFRVEGALSYESVRAETVRLDVEELNGVLYDLGEDLAAIHTEGNRDRRGSWRGRAKREGSILHRELFRGNADLLQTLGMAIQAAREPENLSFCFSGPRNHLGMPYELLYDAEGPLAVRHPLFRQVVGVDNRAESFADLLSGLRHQKKPLNVLLLAADTGGIEVDAEIDAVAEQLRQKAGRLNMRIRTVCVHTAKASMATVQRKLSKCAFHIVHYAGHGQFSPETGENSGLRFWAEEQQHGGIQQLTARALAQLMPGSKTNLFFLSCCVGATVGSKSLLRANEYLGVMDALAQARVPAVLGYRWNVTDSGARTFASVFYDALLETQSPAQATLRARRQIYMDDPTDETWTSPILVMQKQ